MIVLMMPCKSGLSTMRHLKVLFAGHLRRIKWSFLVPLLLDFLVSRVQRSLELTERVS
jgi:hypothetical protein